MQEFTQEELEKEIWKDIPGYEGIYQVSDLGRVKSLERYKIHRKSKVLLEERILKPGVNKHGYYYVVLCKNGKGTTRQIHQLVAIVFLNHIPCGHLIEVNHKDEVRTNNRLENLELLTYEEHLKFTYRNATSRYTGVHFDKSRNKWRAVVTINGKSKFLGYFPAELQAHQAVQKAEEMAKNGDFSFMKPKEYSSQYTGVTFHKATQKWMARPTINGKQKYLGSFTTELEAHEAVQKAEERVKNGDLSFMKIREKTSQYNGISFHKSTQKWQAQITINGKQKHLGLFPTELEAHEAVQKALENLK